MKREELTRLRTRRSPRLQPLTVLTDFGDTRIDVTIADVTVAFAIPSDVGNFAKLSIDRWQWRARMTEWMCVLIACFRFAAEHHFDASLRIELDHHIGAFVHRPDIACRIDAYRMRIAP